MNRRQGWMLVALGVILALGTGVLVFFLLEQQQRSLSAEAQRMAAVQVTPAVATMDLPVAARSLQPGTVIASDDILLKSFPLDLVPVTAITSTARLEKQTLIAPVGQGETFNITKLAGSTGGTVSQQIPTGYVLFVYPVGDLFTQSDILADGDHIDMLITLPVPPAPNVTAPNTQGRDVTAYTLQNIHVFKVLRSNTGSTPSQTANTQPPTALLLALTPEDALLLKRVRDSGSKIDLVLRPVVDHEPVDVPPIDNDVLISRYHLR
ncbi:MAG: Flp pilus assembly protein CpaB [Chloroflexales bacterium]